MPRVTLPTAFMASTGFPSSASRQHSCRYLLAHHSSEMPSPVGFVIRSSASQPLSTPLSPLSAIATAISALSVSPTPALPPTTLFAAATAPPAALLAAPLFSSTPTPHPTTLKHVASALFIHASAKIPSTTPPLPVLSSSPTP